MPDLVGVEIARRRSKADRELWLAARQLLERIWADQERWGHVGGETLATLRVFLNRWPAGGPIPCEHWNDPAYCRECVPYEEAAD